MERDTLLSKCPEIVEKYWDEEKNLGVNPEDFSPMSNKKAWWKCSVCGGSWKSEVSSVTRGRGCPYCSGRKVLPGVNDLATRRPGLLNEWDYEKNSFSPAEVQEFSMKKAWWICDKGHSYSMKIAPKTSQNQGCPYCSGKRVLAGFNDFESQCPELMKDWHHGKNTINPSEVTKSSSKKVWWKCHLCGHEWNATITSRSSAGQGCPECARSRGAAKRTKRNLENGNTISERYPELIKEWDFNSNEIYPTEISPASKLKVHWICPKGHSYLMDPASRTSGGQGCPFCAGKKVLRGFNDFESCYPEIAKNWDAVKNGDVTPDKVIKRSTKEYWFICPDCGQSYKMSLLSRTQTDGPYVCYKCSKIRGAQTKNRNLTMKGHNLLLMNPELAKEWHPVKNGNLTPEMVTPRSSKKVWWVCSSCGFEWKQNVHTRSHGEGCPNCAKAWQTSEPEQVIFYYVKKVFNDAQNSYKDKNLLGRREIDIYIPSLKLGVEYDGEAWHTDIKRDKDKTEALTSAGIDLVRFREEGCPNLNDTSYKIMVPDVYRDLSKLDGSIIQLFDYINKKFPLNVDVNVDSVHDYQEIVGIFEKKKKGNSIAVVCPELISEWHPTKNGYLNPHNIQAGTQKKVWWKCSKCGYEWQTSPAYRTMRGRGTGCPQCAKEKVMHLNQTRQLHKGVNDLVTKHPDLLKEWDYEKNEKRPEEYAALSNKSVYWICDKGHSYKQRIADRVGASHSCPYCSGTKVLTGFNDLATVNPQLARDWNYEKNVDVSPQTISPKSNRVVWWKCDMCGAEWKDTVEHRAAGRKCRQCKGTGTYQLYLLDDNESDI